MGPGERVQHDLKKLMWRVLTIFRSFTDPLQVD
jgi:hypothetical protein